MKTIRDLYFFPNLMDIIHDIAIESLKFENKPYMEDYKKNTQKFYDEISKYCDITNKTYDGSLNELIKKQNMNTLPKKTKEWFDVIKSNLRSELYDLLGGKKWEIEKVSKELGITLDEINAVFDVDCNVSIITVAKILGASDKKLEIVDTKQKQNKQCDGFCHCGSGTSCGKTCTHDMSGDLNDMDRDELLDIIFDNGWDDEIDTKYSTRDELEEFIEEKEAEFEQFVADEDDGKIYVVDFAEDKEKPEKGSTDEYMERLLSDKLKDNPHLAEILKNILKK